MLKQEVNGKDFEKIGGGILTFIYLYKGTVTVTRESQTLRCFSAVLLQVRHSKTISIQIYDLFNI